jgi:hypothetical protein
VDQGVDACDETDGSPRKAMRLKGHTVIKDPAWMWIKEFPYAGRFLLAVLCSCT